MAEQSKTVDAALKLLGLLGAASDGAPAGGGDGSAASLARRLRLSRTAVGRILTTLEAHGMARRTPRGWALGLGLLSLAGRVEPVLRATARGALEDLADRFGETALLALRDGGEVVAIDQVVGTRRVVQVRYLAGARHPLDLSAHGRALLPAAATAEAVVAEDELEVGVKGVAAPIFDVGQVEPVASIGIVAPTHRFPPEAEVVAAVREAALSIGEQLAHVEGDASASGGDRALLPADR